MRARGYLPEEGKDKHFADHFRRIKRPLVDKALSGATAAGDPRVIMVTSALPGDGKTFTSINLALSMALERDISVLLVDCDVAKRHVSDIVGLKKRRVSWMRWWTNPWTSNRWWSRRMCAAFHPAGRQAGRGDGGTLEQQPHAANHRPAVRAQSAPHVAAGFAAAAHHQRGPHPAKIAGQVVLVVRAGHTARHAVQDAVGLIDAQQAGGIILNHVATSGSDGYYGYGSYGSYGANGTEIDAP